MSDAFRKEHADLFGVARKEVAPTALKARVLAPQAPAASGSALGGSVKALLAAGTAIVAVGILIAANARSTAVEAPPQPSVVAPAPSVLAPSVLAPSVQATFTAAVAEEPQPKAVASTKAPQVAAPLVTGSARDEDSLGAEATLLGEAKRALAAGDLSAAGAALRTYARRFPHGALTEEAEALRIEVDVRLGRQQQAKRALDAFEQAHPASPAIARLRRLVAPVAE